MKTFTLRLSDEEAEALNRLAYIMGMSKNQLIASAICRDYNAFVDDGTVITAREEIDPYLFEGNKNFAFNRVKECVDVLDDYGADSYEGGEALEALRHAIKCYDYAIENETDPRTLEQLELEKSDAVNLLRENIL